MDKQAFGEFLKRPEPIVADGGMATSLYDKGFYINRSFEELSVTEAESVTEVTMAFKRAGSEILSTNTFGATIPKLTEYGLQDRIEEIIHASVSITRKVAGEEAYSVGLLGPLGVILEPLGPTGFKEAKELFSKSFKVMDSSGVDGFALVGFHDLNELKTAIESIRETSPLPIMVHMGIQESMKTSYGHSIKELAQMGEDYDLEVIGFAGEVGPSGMLSALEKLRSLTKRPISVMPNAGLPRYVNDQYIYLSNPDYLGKFAKRFVQAGANVIGGHAGVNDQHVQAMANSVRMTKGLNLKTTNIIPQISENGDKPLDVTPVAERSLLGKYLSEGTKIITVEINPPRGVDFTKFASHCKSLQEGGVEFVNIPDGARAIARMSSLQLSSYVKRNFNLEPIPHFTARLVIS